MLFAQLFRGPLALREYTSELASRDGRHRMDYGVHLPLIAFDGRPWSLQDLLEYVEDAETLGFQALSANDHLLFPRPWLDGPTALAAVLSATKRMTLTTTVALPVVRGLVPRSGLRLLRPGLRGSRYPVQGALEAPGRGSAGVAHPLAWRRSAL
jgi:hypothetical protein